MSENETTPPPPVDVEQSGLASQSGKRPERYNTQFLVANFAQQERRNRLIVLAIAIAVIGATGIGLMLSSGPEKPAAHPTAEATENAPPKSK